MNVLDELLQKKGLTYDELTPVEKDTYHQWLQSMSQSPVTIEQAHEYMVQIRRGIEEELAKVGLSSEQDIYLKARLRNAMLLEGFLATKDKAKEQIEKQMAGIINQ